MSDLIDRGAVLDKLRKAENHAFGSFFNGLIKAHKIIADTPSANPEPKRGRWTRDNACSECGYQPWFSGDINNYSFCPNCGAKMER